MDYKQTLDNLAQAVNDGKVEQALSHYADDAVVTFIPTAISNGAPYQGRAAIRGWLQGLKAMNGRVEVEINDIKGDTVYTDTQVWNDTVGDEPLLGHEEIVFADDKIQHQTFRVDPASLERFQSQATAE